MPMPSTSSVQSPQGACAGDAISALSEFDSSNCLRVGVSSGKTVIVSAINIGSSIVSVERVLTGDCDSVYHLPMKTAENCPLMISAATPMQPLKVEGLYRLCISPPNPAAKLKIESIDAGGSACCSISAQCQPAGAPTPPVTATITGISAPLPANFVSQGQALTIAQYIASVQSQVPGATYNNATGTWTAPAGSSFPPALLTIAALPEVQLSSCPFQPNSTWGINGVAYSNIQSYLADFEDYYNVTTRYNATTCRVTILSGDASQAFDATLESPVTQTISPCPIVFPKQWNNNVYANAATFGAAVTAFGGTYVQSGCKLIFPAGITPPALPAAPPSATITAPACPLAFPLLWPVDGVTYATQSAWKSAIESRYDITVTISNVAGNCSVTQTSGAVGALPSGLTLSAAPVAPPAGSGTLSVCPAAPPFYLDDAQQSFANLIALKQAIEALYNVSTTYDATTCTFTKVGGAGTLPTSIAIQTGCGFSLTGVTISDNSNAPLFKQVLGSSAGFAEMRDNAGAVVSLLSPTAQTKCGVSFSVPVQDNSGAVVGYGASL